MEITELIKLFLNQKGLTWNGKLIDNVCGGHRNALDKDFNKDKICDVLVSIPELGIEEMELVISVDLLSFISYGIAFDTPSCFAVRDEYRDILDENNLSKEWQSFCIKNKGLIYKMAVEEFIKKSKLQASDNCHKATIKHIEAIKKETETKNEIFKTLDSIYKQIDNQFCELN